MSRQSRRFSTSRWAEWLVPFLLALLFLALIVALGIVFFSTAGLIPGG
jgi:hypothetical protein